jgi:hypothetical protein
MRWCSLTLGLHGGNDRSRVEKRVAKPGHGEGDQEGFPKFFNKKNRTRAAVSRDLNTCS